MCFIRWQSKIKDEIMLWSPDSGQGAQDHNLDRRLEHRRGHRQVHRAAGKGGDRIILSGLHFTSA